MEKFDDQGVNTNSQTEHAELSASAGLAGSGIRLLPAGLAGAFVMALASCQVYPPQNGQGHNVRPIFYEVVPGTTPGAVKVQQPSVNNSAQLHHQHVNTQPSQKGKINNLQEANTYANAIAQLYSDCRRTGIPPSQNDYDQARNDFIGVTEYSSNHGEGEDPHDRTGNTIAWSELARWLGLTQWLNEYIAYKAKMIQYHQQLKAYNQAISQYGSVPQSQNPNAKVNRMSSKTYRVKPGDTLRKIAKKLQVSESALVLVNPQIYNGNLIFAGSLLKVPK